MEETVVAFSVYIARFFLAFVFIVAGASKLTETDEFERAIVNYRLLPRRFSRPVAVWLPRAELGAGVLLVLGVALVPAAYAVAVLLLAFTAAVSINLLRGKEMSCNCFGASTPEKMTWLTVGRNLALSGMALGVILTPPITLSVWPGPGGALIASPVGATAAVAMLLTTVLLVTTAGLVGQAWRVAKSIRVLQRHFSVEGKGQT